VKVPQYNDYILREMNRWGIFEMKRIIAWVNGKYIYERDVVRVIRKPA